MEKLRAWLSKKGFELRLAPKGEDSVDFAERVVNVNQSDAYPIRLATALHECGHVEIFRRRVFNPQPAVAGATLRQWSRSKHRTVGEKLLQLQEELEAWTLGEALAKRLRVPLPPRCRKLAHRSRSLMSYVRVLAGVRKRRT